MSYGLLGGYPLSSSPPVSLPPSVSASGLYLTPSTSRSPSCAHIPVKIPVLRWPQRVHNNQTRHKRLVIVQNALHGAQVSDGNVLTSFQTRRCIGPIGPSKIQRPPPRTPPRCGVRISPPFRLCRKSPRQACCRTGRGTHVAQPPAPSIFPPLGGVAEAEPRGEG